jgi:hypothetical protein
MTKAQRELLAILAPGGHVWSSYDWAFVYNEKGFGKRIRKGTLGALRRRDWVSEVERTHAGSFGRVRYVISAEGKAALSREGDSNAG